MVNLAHLFDAESAPPLAQLAFPPRPDFLRDESVTAEEELEARIKTTRLMELAGIEDVGDESAEKQAARNAFAGLTAGADDATRKQSLTLLSSPESVRHLVAMLTQHDWDFVEQAAQIRGYTVAKIMEETKHPDARIRLKALELMGKVTEVALFTERVAVRKEEVSDAELDAKIKQKMTALLRLRNGDSAVTDVEPR